MSADTYTCRTCEQTYRRDDTSPGEPTTCADCYAAALADWGKW